MRKMFENQSEVIYRVLSRVLVWGSLFAVLYLLRSFFLLLFLVFIFSYIQAKAVHRLKPIIPGRTPRAVIVGISFLALFVILIAVLVPHIRDQTVEFIANSSTYAHSLDRELLRLAERYPVLEQLMPQVEMEATVPQYHEEWKFNNSTLAGILATLFEESIPNLEKASLVGALQTAGLIGSKLLAISTQFLLALLFSFLIILDLPNLTRGVKDLRNTRLRFVYDEVADSIVSFGATMGRAFEAQFFVATVNTILTASGIWIINIRDEIAFLSLLVFLCGFVPIAGVFISSIPICLVALAEGGMSKVFLTVILIMAVHAIESYILNPRIFGTHMKMNPVVVMILMTVSGKLFGVWGLVLCIPVATYFFQYTIRHKDQKPKELDEASDLDQSNDLDEASVLDEVSGG